MPICLVVGMAGSGKTTLVNALACFLDEHSLPQLERAERKLGLCSESMNEPNASDRICDDSDDSDVQNDVQSAGASEENARRQPQKHESSDDCSGAYVVNLDPAVAELPYESNVDIRDTVKYKEVMREYSLGPNGAIITSLNLFATRFDQVLALIEKRAPESRAILVDTPGQIETFTWSASGAIITESLSVTLPTIILFVVDTPRSESAMTFVSNMLYACSIMYKTRLPLIIVFNKIDVVSSSLATAWMRDFDAFDAALKEDSFASTLARSMAQALEEFYKVMKCVSVSAATDEGMEQLLRAIGEASREYMRDYWPQLQRKRAQRSEEEQSRKNIQLRKLMADMQSEKAGPFAHQDGGDSTPSKGFNDALRTSDDRNHPSSSFGEGSRQLRALRRTDRTVEDPEAGDPGELVDSNPDDAEAYEDFVRYLDALDTKDKDSREDSKR